MSQVVRSIHVGGNKIDVMETSPPDLKDGDGGGTSTPMDQRDHHGRISRLEGSSSVMQWAVGVVSAVMIGGMALLLGGMTLLWSNVNNLQDKVDALPGEIRSELQSLTSSMNEAIGAARSGQQAPTVIVVPQAAGTIEPPPTE